MKRITEHEIFKGLSDPTRLKIMILLGVGELCVCDIVETLGIPQSTISRHFSILKKYGLVKDRRAGKWVYYTMCESSPLIDMKGYFEDLAKSDHFADDIKKVLECKRKNKC
jgi:ArsR family transcriptional regulator